MILFNRYTLNDKSVFYKLIGKDFDLTFTFLRKIAIIYFLYSRNRNVILVLKHVITMLDTVVFISDLILTVKYECRAIFISNSIHKNGTKINTH